MAGIDAVEAVVVVVVVVAGLGFTVYRAGNGDSCYQYRRRHTHTPDMLLVGGT